MLFDRSDEYYYSVGLTENFADHLIERIDSEREHKAMNKRRAGIVSLKLCGYTEQEIADHEGVSQQRISRIING